MESEYITPPPGFKPKPKRKVLTTPSPDEDELYLNIKAMDETYGSYAAFLYLFGPRVSEAIGAPPKQQILERQKKYVKVGTKYRYVNYPVYGEQPISGPSEPIFPNDIYEKDGVLYVRNIPVLKKPDRPLKTKYAVVENEERWVELVMNYVNKQKIESPELPLWQVTRSKAYKAIRKATGLYPHKLRSLRATKDTVEYNLDIRDLQEKYSWSNVTVPLQYIQLRQSDVIEKIKRNAKK